VDDEGPSIGHEPYMYSFVDNCLLGGAGCVGESGGCRHCLVGEVTREHHPDFPVCPPCVCEHYGLPEADCAPLSNESSTIPADASDPVVGYQFLDRATLQAAVNACLEAVPSGVGCYAMNPNICGVGVECGEIGTWDVSLVTDMTDLFRHAKVFNADISRWNTAMVTSMQYMFYYAAAFNQDIGSWDVSGVTSMGIMFGNAAAFNQNIDSWDVSSVTLMVRMFQKAASFNQGIGSWTCQR